jgi:hypothetical protein
VAKEINNINLKIIRAAESYLTENKVWYTIGKEHLLQQLN